MDKESRKVKRNIRKAENQLFRLLFKTIFVIIALILQVAVFWFTFSVGNLLYSSQYYIYAIVRIIAVVYIMSRHDSSLYKIPWMLFILFMPVLGISVFILWGNNRMRSRKQNEIKSVEKDTNYLFADSYHADEYLISEDKLKYNIFNYIKNITSYPACQNSGCKYYNLGEKLFDDLVEDLKNAKKFIFLEYYIIDRGILSNKVFDILKQKADSGVEVKIIYDAYGCINKFKKKEKEDLKAHGIEIYAFNPIPLFLNSYLNNRLHRKIVSIDGNISYTGGVNLADEYANIKALYGHWKDVGVRLEGEVSWSFTLMFLRDLKFIDKKLEIEYNKYRNISSEEIMTTKDNGILCAISDGPNNRKNPIEAVYMQIINTAKNYVYITTPYFAISEPMLESLLTAARSGVDVRIMVPHIPDKKIVQMVTRSYYEVLLAAGVKVYEYAPGFIHSKTFVSDDNISVVGSANMDYRSMSLNYECACVTYMTGSEIDVKEDFLNMVEETSIPIELKDWIKRNWFVKIVESILKTFSTMF